MFYLVHSNILLVLNLVLIQYSFFLNLIDNFLNELVHVTGNELVEYMLGTHPLIVMTVN
jgi:hypothetical protein